MPEAILHLSSLIGSPLLDSAGDRLGRVQDVVARLDSGDGLPPVVGLGAQIGGRQLFVPANRIERLEPNGAHTATTKLNLAQFERRSGEVLLRADILDRSLINVEHARLVKAREVDLVCDDGTWRVAGIDPSFRVRLRRLLPRRFRRHEDDHDQFVAWDQMEAFVGHVPTSRLRLPVRRIARLHPAQIADLVEAASHDEGEEILAAVGHDKELEADVFEELDDEHQVEFLRDRSDQEAAAILERMEPDDAADLLLELDQERRLPVLNLLPYAKQRKVRSLLGFNPSTAGGLMNPDFFSASASARIGDTLQRVRGTDLEPDQLLIVWIVDSAGRLAGGAYLSELLSADQATELGSLIETPLPTVTPETDIPELALLMSDYNLMAMPVVNADGMPMGVVSVDDLMEHLLPEEWRRRAGAARD
ncbi:MAG: magnesium transporter [Chloroflexi bacterium]|nr:magnesium transporter [Chloroflexota bacterium]